MIFNSFSFVIFFIVVVIVYYWLNPKRRNAFLLLSSYFFYMFFNAKYGLLLLAVTLTTYYSAIIMQKVKHKKIVVSLCLAINIGLLLLFKYINFSISIINSLLSHTGSQTSFSLWDIILPIGISFFIFQALGYVIDIYKEKIEVEKKFIDYALFVSFFPQLLSGPIGRSNQLLPQIKSAHYFKYDNAKDGIQLILWGLFKKIVIANRLGIYVDKIYNNLDYFGTYEIAFATLLFAYQIYCDFSGYSDIAVGTAKIMGFDLIRNFKSPYTAVSVSDFWHKWHISLSSWLRDYVYISLGGSRVSKFRHRLNIMITFLVSGIWHGANWTFIIWGGIHGIALIIESINPFKSTNKIKIQFNKLLTFIFVCFAWIFFRANTISDAIFAVKKLTVESTEFNAYHYNRFITGIDFVTFNNVVSHSIINSITIISLILLITTQFALKENDIDFYLNQQKSHNRIIFNTIISLTILFCGVFDNTQFIYFNF